MGRYVRRGKKYEREGEVSVEQLLKGELMRRQYLIPWARYGEPPSLALDKKEGDELWRWVEEQVKGF